MKKVFYLGAVLLLMLWVHPSPLRAHGFGEDHHHGVADDPHWARLDEIAQYLDRHPEATLADLPMEYRRLLSPSVFDTVPPVPFFTGDCNVLVPGIVALISPFIGFPWFPFHRFILGGYPVENALLYAVTCGCCGALPIIDGILLFSESMEILLNPDKTSSRYCDCSKFFLWECGKNNGARKK